MKYEDGQKVLIGDKVDLGGAMTGVVMCSIDDAIYSTEYPESKWGYLKKGIVVHSELAGDMHYPESYVNFVLIERAKVD